MKKSEKKRKKEKFSQNYNRLEIIAIFSFLRTVETYSSVTIQVRTY